MNIINSISWGNSSSTAYVFNGKSKINLTGGILDKSSSPIKIGNNVSIVGLINNSGY